MSNEPLGFYVSDGLVRPSNTTQYAQNDVICGGNGEMLHFRNICRSPGQPFYILNAYVRSSNPAATPAVFKLNLYRRRFAIASDNSAFAPSRTDSDNLLGVIQFDLYHKFTTIEYYLSSSFNYLHVVPDPSAYDIWGVLIADSSYTPASAEDIRVFLSGSYEIC